MTNSSSSSIFYSTILTSFIISEIVVYLLSNETNVSSNGWKKSIENIFVLIILVTIPYIVSNYSLLFPNFLTFLFILLTPVIWTMITYLYLPHEGSQLNTVNDWTRNEIIINSIFLSGVVIIILAHLLIAYKKHKLKNFLSWLALITSVITILYLISYYTPGEGLFHLHHWFLGWIFSFFTIFYGNAWSEIGAGIAFGSMVHSFSNYDDNLNFFD